MDARKMGQVYEVRLVFKRPTLGTASGDRGIYTRFVASKRPDGVNEEELATLPDFEAEVEDLAGEMQLKTTYLRRTPEGVPALIDYMIKGFFKDACGALRRVPSSESAKLKAYKQVIDGTVFVHPWIIPLEVPTGGEISIIERPLRASTPKGERICLARSESVPLGTALEFRVRLLSPDAMNSLLREWLSFGALRGLGQWRNSGMGSFDCTLDGQPLFED